jgi:hypothetical protein
MDVSVQSLDDDLSRFIDKNDPEDTTEMLGNILTSHVIGPYDDDIYFRVWIVRGGDLVGKEKKEPWMEADGILDALKEGELEEDDVIVFPPDKKEELEGVDDIMNAFGYRPHQQIKGSWCYFWRPK